MHDNERTRSASGSAHSTFIFLVEGGGEVDRRFGARAQVSRSLCQVKSGGVRSPKHLLPHRKNNGETNAIRTRWQASAGLQKLKHILADGTFDSNSVLHDRDHVLVLHSARLKPIIVRRLLVTHVRATDPSCKVSPIKRQHVHITRRHTLTCSGFSF